MAESRKHKTSAASSAIGKALEQALGAAARPVTPGAPPRPNQPDNQHLAQPRATAAAPLPSSGWMALPPEKAPKLARQTDEEEQDEDQQPTP